MEADGSLDAPALAAVRNSDAEKLGIANVSPVAGAAAFRIAVEQVDCSIQASGEKVAVGATYSTDDTCTIKEMCKIIGDTRASDGTRRVDGPCAIDDRVPADNTCSAGNTRPIGGIVGGYVTTSVGANSSMVANKGHVDDTCGVDEPCTDDGTCPEGGTSLICTARHVVKRDVTSVGVQVALAERVSTRGQPKYPTVRRNSSI